MVIPSHEKKFYSSYSPEKQKRKILYITANITYFHGCIERCLYKFTDAFFHSITFLFASREQNKNGE